MKCPRIVSSGLKSDSYHVVDYSDCLRGDCGLWDEQTELCSDVAEVRVLAAIGSVLGRIHDIMARAEKLEN